MIFGQLASAAVSFVKFHAGTRKSLSDLWSPLLKQPIKFVFISFQFIGLILPRFISWSSFKLDCYFYNQGLFFYKSL